METSLLGCRVPENPAGMNPKRSDRENEALSSVIMPGPFPLDARVEALQPNNPARQGRKFSGTLENKIVQAGIVVELDQVRNSGCAAARAEVPAG